MGIVVVGGSGFIGSRLSSLFLRDRLDFKIVDKVISESFPKVTVIADVRSIKALNSAISENSILINLAAEHRDDVKPLCLYDDVNVQGAKNLCLVATKKNVKSIIFTSSVAVYGLSEGNLIDENYELQAKDPYGLSKIQAEKLIIEWCKNKGISFYILRLPLIIGNHAPGNLGAMVNGIKNNRYARIGNGNAKKSMVLAKDIAYLVTNLKGESGIYNLTDGYHPSFKELEVKISEFYSKKIVAIPNIIAIILAKVGDFMGNKAPINSLKLKKITATLIFSDEKAKKNLNWNPNKVLESWKLQ